MRSLVALGIFTAMALPQVKNSVTQHSGDCTVNIAGSGNTASLVCRSIDPKIAQELRAILNGTRRNESATKDISQKLDLILKQVKKDASTNAFHVEVLGWYWSGNPANGDFYIQPDNTDTLYRVDLVVPFKIANLQDFPVMIDRLGFEVETADGSWTGLKRIAVFAGQAKLYDVFPPPLGLKKAGLIENIESIDDVLFKRQLSPHQPLAAEHTCRSRRRRVDGGSRFLVGFG